LRHHAEPWLRWLLPAWLQLIDRDARRELVRLGRLLTEAGDFVMRFSARGWLVQFVMSSGDRIVFETLDARIQRSMGFAAFAVAIAALGGCSSDSDKASKPSTYSDESEALRTAIMGACREEGLRQAADSANVQAMLQQLAAKCPNKLRVIMRNKCGGSIEIQVRISVSYP
jgi:hypothetical protein